MTVLLSVFWNVSVLSAEASTNESSAATDETLTNGDTETGIQPASVTNPDMAETLKPSVEKIYTVFVYPAADRDKTSLPVTGMLAAALEQTPAMITNMPGELPDRNKPAEWISFMVSNSCDALLSTTITSAGKGKKGKITLEIRLTGTNSGKPLFSGKYVFERKDLTNRVLLAAKELSNTVMKQAEIKRKILDSETAFINFVNYKIGREKYVLRLDGETVDTPVNNNFGLKLTVKPRREHRISVSRQDDGSEAYGCVVKLQPGETRIIDYTAKGTVTVRPVQNPELWKTYRYYFNRLPVNPETLISNVWAGLDHEVKVYDNRTNLVFSEVFYLKDGENREVRPVLKEVTGFHPRIYTSMDAIAGVGADWLFTRNLWAGAGMGLASAVNLSTSGTVIVMLPYVQAGYYLWNDLSQSFRAGAGIMFQGCLSLPDTPGLLQGQFMGIGVFGIAEYLVFFIQPAVFYDFTQFRFRASIGVKF